MVKYLITALLSLAFLVFPRTSNATEVAQFDNNKKLIIKGDMSFPPYEFINDKGEPDGFNVELTRAIMEVIHRPYELTLGSWVNVMQSLKAHEIDLITTMIYSNERALTYKFGITHCVVYHCAVCRHGARYTTFDSLKDKRIIVQNGEFGHEMLREAGYDKNAIVVESMTDGLKRLAAGEGDVAFCGTELARYILFQKGLTDLEIFDLGLSPHEYSFAANDEELLADVARGLHILKENGEYDRLYNKWLTSGKGWSHKNILTAFGIFIFLVLLLLLVNRWLHHKIKVVEENVRIGTERYVTLFENTVVGLEYYDKKGILVDLNTADCELYGVPDKKALIDSNISLFDNPLFRTLASHDHIQPYSGILEYDLRKQYREKYFDLSTRDEVLKVHTRIFPIYNRNGELQSIIATSIDMTEVEQLRTDLETTTGHLRLALKAGDLEAWTYDLKRRIFTKLVSNEEKRERTYQEYMDTVHPDDWALTTHSFRQIMTGQVDKMSVQFRCKAADGQYRYHEGELIGIKDNGSIVAIAGTQKDITERIEQRRLLENTIKKLHYAIKASNTVFFEYDAQTKLFKAYNEPLNGYDENQLLSLEFYMQNTHPEDVKRTHAIVEGLDANCKEQVSIDVRHKIGEDNQWHYCTITIAPFEYDDDGRVVRFVGFRRDNTKWIQGRKRLEEYKIKMELAIRSSLIQVWEYDCIDQIFYTDKDSEKQVDEFRTLGDYIRYTHPEDLDRVQNVLEIIGRGEQQSLNIEFRIKRPEMSTWHYLTLGCVPFSFDDNGRCLKYAGYRLDSTHWHELSANLESSTQLLNTIVDTLPCALFIKDLNDQSRYIIANEYMVKTMHKTKEEIIGHFDREIYDSQEYCDRFRESDRLAIENGSYTYKEHLNFGEEQVFHNIKLVINTVNGRRLLVGIALDITSLDKMMQELQLEKEKAQQADKLKSAFLANMSHEIRTPLNAIVGFSQLLQYSESEAERSEYIQIINTNSELMLRLVSDILDLSKIESGLIDLKPERIDMSSVFEETYHTLRQRCTNPEIDFIGHNPYEFCYVTMDKNRMLQVGMNFLTNAIKYTERGRIVMGYEYVDGGIRLYVEDTGIGIPEEKQSRVFQRFEKLDSFAQGTGLGLAISKAIIEVMGGKIGFSSKAGVGSTFWAWIPCDAEITERGTAQ